MKRVFHLRLPLLKKSFFAINLFGFIFARRELTPVELNHERIHTAQQRELLYVGFYLWYVIEWGILFLIYRNMLQAYHHIRFEREAYRHQADMNYLSNRRHYRYS